MSYVPDLQTVISIAQVLLNCLMTGFMFAAAVAAWLSAHQANKAARETHYATQAQITNSLFATYATDDVLDAIIALQKWSQGHGDNFADEFRRLRQEDYAQVEQVDRGRRRIAHYFERLFALWKAGAIDEKVVRIVASQEQVTLLRQVVEPLEAALNPKYERATFDALASLYELPARSLPMANPKSWAAEPIVPANAANVARNWRL